MSDNRNSYGAFVISNREIKVIGVEIIAKEKL